MALIKANVDEVEEFEAIPAGTYLARITNAEEKIASSGKSMIACEAEVAEGEFQGTKLWFNTMIKVKSKKSGKMITNFYLKRLVEALKVDWPPKGFQTEDFFGQEFMAVVGQREYQGRMQNNVTDYFPPK